MVAYFYKEESFDTTFIKGYFIKLSKNAGFQRVKKEK